MEPTTIDKLATALAKAQGEISHAVKDVANPHLKSKYADLASVWAACRAPLSRHGLAVAQFPVEVPGGWSLRTLLLHESGQSLESMCPVIVRDPANPQAFGAGLTYARRYALSAMIGIAPDDDDDGHAANQPPARAEPPRQPVPPPAEPAQRARYTGTPGQRATLDQLVASHYIGSPEDLASLKLWCNGQLIENGTALTEVRKNVAGLVSKWEHDTGAPANG